MADLTDIISESWYCVYGQDPKPARLAKKMANVQIMAAMGRTKRICLINKGNNTGCMVYLSITIGLEFMYSSVEDSGMIPTSSPSELRSFHSFTHSRKTHREQCLLTNHFKCQTAT